MIVLESWDLQSKNANAVPIQSQESVMKRLDLLQLLYVEIQSLASRL
jgi:hypothetical protein